MRAPMNQPIKDQGLTVEQLTSDDVSLTLGLNDR
jgi:hypothetical protein